MRIRHHGSSAAKNASGTANEVPPVKFLFDRWDHHAAPSGYDAVVPRLGTRLAAPDQFRRTARIVPWRVARRFVFEHAGMRHYGHHQLYYELAAARDMARSRRTVYHIMEGDFGYRYLGRLDGWRGHRVVATFHLPPERLTTDVVYRDHLGRLAAVIVVGENQCAWFADVVRPERLHWVPVGVDTEYFRPAPNGLDPTAVRPDPGRRRAPGASPLRALFVGRHMRDLSLLEAVLRRAAADGLAMRTTVVTDPGGRARFADVPGVNARSDVSDVELLALYQGSDVLLQPLLNATAVIALLESMACGLPAVVSDVGGVRSYVDEGCAVLVPPRDPRAMFEAVAALAAAPERRAALAAAARDRALRFDWAVVAERLRALYRGVMAA